MRPLEGFRRPGHNNLAGTTRQERFTVFDNRARPPLACPKEYFLAILAGLLKQSYTPCQTHDGQIWDSSLRSPSPRPRRASDLPQQGRKLEIVGQVSQRKVKSEHSYGEFEIMDEEYKLTIGRDNNRYLNNY